MRFDFFRAKRNQPLIARLHGEIVAAARHPVFYLEFGVPDTFEGRFELVTLHAGLVLRHLAGLPDPASALARDITDAVFSHFDAALRETGTGDIAVPKKMKRLTEAWLGRNLACDAALKGQGEALEAVLLRNVLAGKGDAARLAAYVRQAAQALASLGFADVVARPLPFPDAATAK